MRARIYRPAKSAMQSGRANTRAWILEFEPRMAKRPDPLMGWAGSADTLGQVRLRFASKEEAVAYASRHGIDFWVMPERDRRIPLRSYAENFR